MKRNISDLLDCYLEEELEPDSTTYLSSRRIKEMTMKKISKKENDTNLRRLPSRIFIGVAAAAMLTVSAFAAGDALGAGELLRSYFGGEDLTQGQVQTMDAIGTAFEGGVSSNGATLTPLAALADENVYYLRLRVQAPEGTVLPDLDEDTGYYQLSGDTAEESMDLDLSAYPGEGAGYCSDISWLPDQDPTDNIKEAVVRFQVLEGEGETDSPLKFNDGVSKPLTIHGLWVQAPDKGYTEIFSGEYVFDIGENYESRSVSLDCQGLRYQCPVVGYTVYPESMTLSPLSLSGVFNCTLQDNHWVGAGMGPVTIVLKDGSTFFSQPNYEPAPAQLADIPLDEIPISDTPDTQFRVVIFFDEPLDLSQVDHVEYGGQKIPVEVK